MFTLTLGNHPLSRAYVFRWIWNYHRANLLLLWMHLLFRWKFCMSNQSRVLASDRKKDKTCESETTLKKEHEIKHLVEFFSSENICFNPLVFGTESLTLLKTKGLFGYKGIPEACQDTYWDHSVDLLTRYLHDFGWLGLCLFLASWGYRSDCFWGCVVWSSLWNRYY